GDITAGGAVTFGADKSGTVKTAGDITTTDDDVTFTNAVTQSGDVSIDTGSGAGNILFKSTVATADKNLTLDAGSAGDITADKSITGGGVMTVVDGAVQKYSGAITVDSLDIKDATTSVTLDGDVTTETTLDINTLTGKLIQNAKVDAGSSVDYDAAGTIEINKSIKSGTTLDIDATGVTTVAEAGDITAGGAVTFGRDKTGTLTTAGEITTTDDDVTFANAVTQSGDVSIDTGSGAGNILFKSTVATADKNLTLDAGAAGDITADKSITGGGAFTVVDGAVQKYSGAITVDSLDIKDATTSVKLDGDITTETTLDINSGGTLTQNAKVIAGTSLDYDAATIGINNSMGAGSSVDIDATGGTIIAETGDITAGGAVTFGRDKTGTLTTAGEITTTDDDVTFTNAVTQSGDVAIDTGG
ncbi:MAG: hypothetical protein VYC03_06985, partial [Pseudomonadota bacterium]|nr:hypothetical protein [Pseudomonadota bacterium]